MKKIGIHNRVYKSIIYQIMLAVTLLLFYVLYLYRCYPVNEGWHITYAQLVLDGKVPYRDFYFYMPPLDIFLNVVFWKLSFGKMIIFRIWMMIIRISMMELIFSLLKSKVRIEYAFFASIIGGVFIAGNVWDLLGDYNQIIELTCVCLAYTLKKYVTSETKYEKLWLFISGIVFGLGACEKQSFMVAAGIVLFLFLIGYTLLIRKNNLGVNFLIAFAGFVLPIVLFCIYFAAKGALTSMIQQVYLDADSKGSIKDIIYTPLKNTFFHFDLLMIAVLIVLIIAILSKNVRLRHEKVITTVLGGLALLGVYLYDKVTFRQTLSIFVKSGLIVFYLLIIGTMIFAWKKIECKCSVKRCAAIMVLFVLSELFAVIPLFSFSKRIMDTAAFSNLNIIYTICFYGLCLYIFWEFYKAIVGDDIDIVWIVFSITAFISCFAAMMASGEGLMQSRAMVFTTPICISKVLDSLNQEHYKKRIIVYLTGLFACTIIFSQKVIAPYSWWGSSSSSIYEETYKIDIPSLAGFRVSRQQKTMYEEVYKSIELNSNDEDRILGFPGVTVFNLLCDKMDFPGKVPVYFYDVCGDKYAEADAKSFNDDYPEFVIWWDIPGALETHEAIFRSGTECGQRQIVYWFQNNLDSYSLVCQVNNVFVYKYDDGRPINYTYIDDKNRINVTLEKDYR